MLGPILAQTPVGRIEEVVARMTAIDQALPPADGISCFNKLYLEVTKSVLGAVGQTTFAGEHDQAVDLSRRSASTRPRRPWLIRIQ